MAMEQIDTVYSSEPKTAMLFTFGHTPDTIQAKFERSQSRTFMSTNNVTRHELDAKLETIETKMDARIDRIEETGKRIEANCEDLKKEFRNGKWWAIGTAIAAVGLIFTVIQLNVSWQQNFLTSLDNRIGYVNSKVDAITPAQEKHHK